VTSYRDAGVDLEAASRHVESIAGAVEATWGDRVVGGFGGFAAGIEIPDRYKSPVLMMSADGVGTKLELARRTGLWAGVGFDLAAMCVDDLAAVGAEPLGFVDYLAVGALSPRRDSVIVESIAAACGELGCALLGGETACHPGVMAPDAVDLAGAAAGVVEKGAELGPHRVGPGDVVIGLKSPNLRSNGFSLVRSVFGDELGEHAERLLEPSVIYAPAVLRAKSSGGVHAAAHVTGGGIVENLSRALPDGVGATIDTNAWAPPAVFDLVADRGVSRDDMFRTFNMGIGYCLVVGAASTQRACKAVSEHEPTVIGATDPSGAVRLA